MAPRGGPAFTTLLDQHNSLLHSKFPYTLRVATIFHQRSLSLQHLFTESHHKKISVEQNSVINRSLGWEPSISGFIPIPAPASRYPREQGRGAERLYKPEYQEVCYETVCPKYSCTNKVGTRVVLISTIM